MYTYIQTIEEGNKAIDFMGLEYEIVSLDIETTGLDFFIDSILLVQVKIKGKILIFDIRKLGYGFLTQLTSLLSNKLCILHNAKFDMKFIKRRTGITLPKVFCTFICEAVINAGKEKIGMSLRDLVERYCGKIMEKESRNDFIGLPTSSPITGEMLTYSALDVDVLEEIYLKQMDIISKAREIKVIELEMELVPVVMGMEYIGIKLDPVSWCELEGKNKEKLIELTESFKEFMIDSIIKLYDFTGITCLFFADKLFIPAKTKRLRKLLEETTDISSIRKWLLENFNVNSPKQMVTAINLLGCNVTSTTEKVIAPFAKDHESIRKLLEVREVGKSVSTYGLTWLKNIHPIDGRVHTEYFTGGTVTGRFSSSNPNMQNLPVHGGFRECFIPEEDYVYISCDYSQQEYRLAGAVSGEPIIIDAYKNNSDMHTATAANFFDKPMNEVTKDERSWGKTRNFEIIYGTTEWGLSKSLKSTVKYAKDVLDKYWAGYPTLAKFKEAVEAKILELGYSCTPLGRRRYNLERPVFATPWELEMWKSQAKREGFNLIIQGGGADIMKIAMVNLYKNNIFGDKFRLLLQIHDELLVEVHKSIIEEAGQFLKKEMIEAEQVFLGEIPAVVEGFDQVKMRWTK